MESEKNVLCPITKKICGKNYCVLFFFGCSSSKSLKEIKMILTEIRINEIPVKYNINQINFSIKRKNYNF